MRVAWVMKLKPGHEEIYKRKHDEIWPEMLAMMEREGIRNYSIYRHGLTLFAYLERDTPAPGGKPPADSIIWKWWEWMAPHMETNPDTSPVTEPVEEMFYFPGR
ncbi:MAG TPA: L-rhamnose mutarotase [Alphaproteobacteria bacterium]|nr:L-rhamnose mutarotase [Alphaproteobacteria bacterium]